MTLPSREAFVALRSSVEGLDERAFAALRAELATWPDDARCLRWAEDEDALASRWGSLATAFEIAECDALAAVRKLAKVARAEVRVISFFACEGTADAVQRLDDFSSLHTLDLGGEGLDEAVFDALSTLSLPALRTLRLTAAHPPVTLSETDFWPALTSLALTLEAADALGIAALFHGARCPRLEDLAIDVGSRVDVCEALRESPVVSSLRRLGEVEITEALAPLVARAPELSALTAFVIDALPATLPVLAQLKTLELRGPVGDEGMRRMVEAAPNLRHLAAHQVGLGPRGAAAIGSAFAASGLVDLVLSMNDLGDEGAAALAPALGGVVRLNLHHTRTTAMGLRALSAHFGLLRELHLRGNPLGPEGAAILASTPMPALRSLWLGGCGIEVAGAKALAASSNLAHLTFFDLDLAHADRALVPHGTHALAHAPHASASVRAQFAAWKEPPPPPPKTFWQRLFGGR